MKTCKKCSKELPLSFFRKKYRKKKDGEMSYACVCSVCENTENKQRYIKKYREDGNHRRNAYRYTLRTTYSMSEEDFTNMLSAQDNKCPICTSQLANPFTKTEGLRPNVDHCHTAGNVRNILCQTCNTGLGSFKDSISLLTKAAQYLGKHNEVRN